MVKLEEVLDEEFNRPAGEEQEDEWGTDTESIASSLSDDDEALDESLADRIAALSDIVPPHQRRMIANTASAVSSYVASGLRFSGKALWVVSTSALLLGVPWALAFAEEQQMVEMEREMKMQQSANDLLTQQPGGAKPAL